MSVDAIVIQGRLIIHIGWPKTGTSSLQAFLQTNRERFNSLGIEYPCDENLPFVHAGHHGPLAACLDSSPPDYVPAAKNLAADIVLRSLSDWLADTSHDVVLSSEHLSFRLADTAAVARLCDAISGRQVSVFCHLRRQDELALSAYGTEVLCGRQAPFSTQEINPSNVLLNYSKALKPWVDAFGADNIALRAWQPDTDTRHELLCLLGLPPDGFTFGRLLNESLGFTAIEMLRAVNAHLADFDLTPDIDTYRASIEARLALCDVLPAGTPLSRIIDPVILRAVLAGFREENLWLARTFNDATFCRDWTEAAASPSLHGTTTIIDADLKIDVFAQALARAGTRLAGVSDSVVNSPSSPDSVPLSYSRSTAGWARRMINGFVAKFRSVKHGAK